MSDGEAAWSGWGAPLPRPQPSTTPFDADDGDSKDRARAQPPASSAMSKNRMRRQRRGLVGHDPVDQATCPSAVYTLPPAHTNDAPYHDHGHGRCDENADNDCHENRHAHTEAGDDDDALCPLASPTCIRVSGAVENMIQLPPPDLDDDRHATGPLGDEHGQATGADRDERRDHSKKSTDEHQHVRSGGKIVQHQRAFHNDAQDDNSEDVTASDTNDDDSDDLENNEPDKGRLDQDHDHSAGSGRARGTSSGTVAIAHGPHKNHRRRRTDASGGALTRILVKSRPDECSPLTSIIVEGDVLSCRTCGLSSTARQSSRMGVYVGGGRVVHAVQRRQRGTSSHGDVYYEVVQQTLQDFAQGKTLSADEWFRTRSEFPAAVRVRRALERVGAEWEVPDGLNNARVSEDFALWTATGQSALTHADYRDDRDDCESSSNTTAPLAYHSSSFSSSKKRRNRRDSGDRGIVARAVRVGSDSPPPVLARIHQPPTTLSMSAASPATREAARPAPVASDYRHAVAGGIVGLYLGGPIGGAVGGAAGLLLDSMASLGRGWRP
ncbi:hypothetical protein pmac_cds_81 [Pandoravirus macleodensis]|uniref:Endopeptidase domain containing protein n=1 Tax=Pandoravirus macleodensis TaxID=2107707 RepID=A0A2U7UE70_9VIRU|nr:hypothetical protein pmac_cds_81 [Pandoravirus macleodensis]AVK76769.1 hypothetical protein pmac_cds_81 [Pandoravirus macleodensis]